MHNQDRQDITILTLRAESERLEKLQNNAKKIKQALDALQNAGIRKKYAAIIVAGRGSNLE